MFQRSVDCVVPSLLQTPGTVVKLLAEKFVDGKFPSSSPDEWLSKVSKLMSVEALKGLRQDVQKNVDEAGIACFSKVRDDILMWAHYADKHRGLCLEFDGSENCNFFGEALAVEYENFTPVPLGEDSMAIMKRIILTKSKHWSYEREYRIFRPKLTGRKLDYPVELLTGVISAARYSRTSAGWSDGRWRKGIAAWLSSRLSPEPLNSVSILCGSSDFSLLTTKPAVFPIKAIIPSIVDETI